MRSEIISKVEESGSTGKDNIIDVISSTKWLHFRSSTSRIKRKNIRLTVLLSPFKESPSHFKNSCEGTGGGSSILGASLGAAGRDPAGPLVQTEEGDPAALRVEVEGVIAARTVDGIEADAFPVAPTVVQAPPPD